MFLSLAVVGNKIDLPRIKVDQKLAQGFGKQWKMAATLRLLQKQDKESQVPVTVCNLYVWMYTDM